MNLKEAGKKKFLAGTGTPASLPLSPPRDL